MSEGYPEDLREQVDDYLAALRFGDDPSTEGLSEAMRYSLLAGGKRIRPVLTLATAEAVGLERAAVLPTAAGIELIHSYSLIHDDLPAMDDDDLRRGRPTSHRVYGENVAILAGDGLFAEALRLIAERQRGPAERVVSVLLELGIATGVGGMVGGQYVDVTNSAAGGEGGSERERLRHLHGLKTGRLIAASVSTALILADASDSERMHYDRFATELGVLFQIVDDILDVTGSDEELGKPSGSDERHGKLTYVSLYGLDKARELAAASHRAACSALADTDGETGYLERVTDFIYTRQS